MGARGLELESPCEISILCVCVCACACIYGGLRVLVFTWCARIIQPPCLPFPISPLSNIKSSNLLSDNCK